MAQRLHPAVPPRAGQLRHRVAFDKRAMVDDGYGNPQSGDFAEQFVVAAGILARVGGETVMAARLTGQQPVTIIVRQSAQTRQIAPDWRARNARTGVVYAIRSIIDPDDDQQWLEILAETGVAA